MANVTHDVHELRFDPCHTFLKNSITQVRGFKLAHLNTCSLVCHLDQVKQIFSQTGFDCVGFSETWLNDSLTNSLIKFDDYRILRHDRTSRGGGVALYVRPYFKPKIIKSSNPGSTEYLFCELTLKNTTLLVGVVYKPPQITDVSSFEEDLAQLRSIYNNIVLMGDSQYREPYPLFQYRCLFT